VAQEMVQSRRDRSGFFGKMLVTHTDKYASTKRIVPVFLSGRGRLLGGQLPGARAGIPGSGHRGAKLRPPGNCVFKPRSSSVLEVRQWGVSSGNSTSWISSSGRMRVANGNVHVLRAGRNPPHRDQAWGPSSDRYRCVPARPESHQERIKALPAE
jgi:hypothetical protein